MQKVTLSPRELQVLVFLSAGYSQRETGNQLGISASSVATYVQRAQVKLSARSPIDAVVRALNSGLIVEKNYDQMLTVKEAVRISAEKARR